VYLLVQPEGWFCPFAPSDTIKYTELLFNRLPSTVPVEKIPHDLCPVPQPDTTGKAGQHQQDPYFKDLLAVWRGMTPKRERAGHRGGEMGPHPCRCEVVWTHQQCKESLMYSMRGSGPLLVNIVSCWGCQSSPAACPFQLTMLGPG